MVHVLLGVSRQEISKLDESVIVVGRSRMANLNPGED